MLASAMPVSLPAQPSPPVKEWFKKYVKTQIVAIDCEFVKHLMNNKKDILATVAIVDFNEKVLLNRTVRRGEGTFQTTWHTRRINGIGNRSLMNGEKGEEEVLREVHEILDGKLVIMCGGVIDRQVLGVCGPDFDVFDLHDHYWIITSGGGMENLGLRRLYWNYYEEDCQAGAHTALADAISTMRVFHKFCQGIRVDPWIRINTTETELYKLADFPQLPEHMRSK